MIIRYSEFGKIRSKKNISVISLLNWFIGSYFYPVIKMFKFFCNNFLTLSLYCNIYFVFLHYFSMM